MKKERRSIAEINIPRPCHLPRLKTAQGQISPLALVKTELQPRVSLEAVWESTGSIRFNASRKGVDDLLVNVLKKNSGTP